MNKLDEILFFYSKNLEVKSKEFRELINRFIREVELNNGLLTKDSRIEVGNLSLYPRKDIEAVKLKNHNLTLERQLIGINIEEGLFLFYLVKETLLKEDGEDDIRIFLYDVEGKERIILKNFNETDGEVIDYLVGILRDNSNEQD